MGILERECRYDSLEICYQTFHSVFLELNHNINVLFLCNFYRGLSQFSIACSRKIYLCCNKFHDSLNRHFAYAEPTKDIREITVRGILSNLHLFV